MRPRDDGSPHDPNDPDDPNEPDDPNNFDDPNDLDDETLMTLTYPSASYIILIWVST